VQVLEIITGTDVFNKTVTAVNVTGNTQSQLVVNKGNIDDTFVGVEVVVAKVGVEVAAKFIVGLVGVGKDRATCGIAAKQRTLRALQHLDAGNIIGRY